MYLKAKVSQVLSLNFFKKINIAGIVFFYRFLLMHNISQTDNMDVCLLSHTFGSVHFEYFQDEHKHLLSSVCKRNCNASDKISRYQEQIYNIDCIDIYVFSEEINCAVN